MFKDFGYYIPLKIYIGGYFYKDININKDNESMKKYLDFQANVEIPLVNVSGNYSSQSENYLKNFFYNENLVIKGGDINKESLDDWKLSINFDNSEIIDYSNLIEITELINDALDKQTKKLLKIPLSLVDEKYIKRKKYFENLKELNNYPNMGNIKGGDSIRNGIFKTDELIYSEVIEIRNNKNIDYSYPDLIVGWKIDCFWQDRNKGDYSMTDPINSRRVKGSFSVKENNGLNLILEIFFLKCPE